MLWEYILLPDTILELKQKLNEQKYLLNLQRCDEEYINNKAIKKAVKQINEEIFILLDNN